MGHPMQHPFSRRIRRPGRLTALALAAFLALASVAQAAPSPQPTSSPDAEDAKLNAIFTKFDAKRDVIEARLRSLELRLIEVQEKLNKLRRKSQIAERDLVLRKAELAQTIQDLEDQKELTADSAAGMYMRGPFSYLNAMLNASSLGDLVRVEEYSETVLNDFIRVVHELEGKKVLATKAYAAARKKALDLRKQVKEVERDETSILEDQQLEFSRRQYLINDLIADFGGIEELRKHGFDIIIKSYSGSSTRIVSLLEAAQKDQDVAQEGEYVLRRPTLEQRITSAYGWRLHPIWGYRSFHTGIDIGSDYGDDVKASLSGRVVEVDYMGAYGLTVIIDHGHSLATVYAHMSRAIVQPGDKVLSGEKIGTVGCCGWCTGPHVHYEVRLRTKPVSPVHWL
ncbi:MAG: murein hydrolase activator EnvC family protein [Actinomycetota bacterium]